MAKNDTYTIKSGSQANTVELVKFDRHGEYVDTYLIAESPGGGLTCSCPAHVAWCRHMDILQAFKAEDRIDSGWTYSHDQKKWFEPLKLDDM